AGRHVAEAGRREGTGRRTGQPVQPGDGALSGDDPGGVVEVVAEAVGDVAAHHPTDRGAELVGPRHVVEAGDAVGAVRVAPAVVAQRDAEPDQAVPAAAAGDVRVGGLGGAVAALERPGEGANAPGPGEPV